MVKITDFRGIPVRLDGVPERIVSLVPSLTETVADLGMMEKIVGCTSFCDRPEGLMGKLRKSGGIVGGPKDCEVDGILGLKPDLVLASREENLKKTVREVEEFTRVYVANPRTVGDSARLIGDFGRLFGIEERAGEWVGRIGESIAGMGKIRGSTRVRRFIYLVWWNPVMVAGGDTYISNLLEEGLLRNAYRERGRYPEVEKSEIGGIDVDIIFTSTEPYVFGDGEKSEIGSINEKAEVVDIDGRMCAWYGTRTALAIEYLKVNIWN